MLCAWMLTVGAGKWYELLVDSVFVYMDVDYVVDVITRLVILRPADVMLVMFAFNSWR